MKQLSNKKRIFLVNDASFLSTGYSIYGREILKRLHNSQKFEVAELGCYCDTSSPDIKNVPWKFYPNGVASGDSRHEQYKSNHLNRYGLWRFNRCLADFKPHIVFDIRDYWMFAYQESSPYKKYFHWIVMPAIDSAPPKVEWLYTYNNADIVVPYTEWARKVLRNSGGKNINLFDEIANAGINPTELYPIDNKTQHKIKYFGENVSVVGLVMRNQKRKLFPDILQAYKQYLDQIKVTNSELYNKSYLYLHTSYPEDNGWDLPSLLLEYGLLDKVYFTYVCRQCKNFYPSKFQSPIRRCKSCNNGIASIASPNLGVTTTQLNEIYNFFDLFIQYAICEGFGMPQIEAAACGVPIASVDFSAMSEIVESLEGIKIPVDRVFRELETNADRVYPDINKTTKILLNFFTQTNEEKRLEMGIVSRKKCVDKYTWDHVYAVWEKCFDNIDINRKLQWESNHKETTSHGSIKVPKNLTNTEFVEFICHNVINNPELLKTANIQCLIRDLNNGLIVKDGSITAMTKNQAVQILDGYLNNKIMCENMRVNKSTIIGEDFIK